MPEQTIIKAKAFAIKKHATLLRPNKSNEPKIVHLAEVAALVTEYSTCQAVISAAWLHDVVEDTDASLEEIFYLFGSEIYELVKGLTDPLGYEALPLSERKALQVQRVVKLPPSVKAVKLCDQISNIFSVYSDPPSDWDASISYTYIEGAERVGIACRGISSSLDKRLSSISILAKNKYAELA